MMGVFSCIVAVCTIMEVMQPPQVSRPATFLGTADERLLVLRLGMWPNRHVGPSSFEKIRPGMTVGEVEKVLGSPTKERSVPETVMMSTPTGVRGIECIRKCAWVGMDQVIVIHFGKKQTVELKDLDPLEQWASVDCNLDTRNDFVKLRDWIRP